MALGQYETIILRWNPEKSIGKAPTWRPRGLSKWVISRVISTPNGVTLVITLLTKSPGPPSMVLNPKP